METTSILQTIKKMLGASSEYTLFDPDIIVYINSAINTLNMLGLTSADNFHITGENETWNDLLGDTKNLEMIKTYIHLKVKKDFDPPTNGTVMESLKNSINELEWRINVMIENGGAS